LGNKMAAPLPKHFKHLFRLELVATRKVPA